MTGTISTTITGTYNLLAQYTTVLNTGEVTVTSGVAIAGTYVSSGFGWTITNSGTVLNSAPAKNGIDLRGIGDQVTNDAGGVIIAAGNAVYAAHDAATVFNAGSIAGTGTIGYGVKLGSGGSVTNAATASITGLVGVAIEGSVGTVANGGSIAGTHGTAIELFSGGSVTNAAAASITGDFAGVFIGGAAGKMINAGNISGTGTTGYGVILLSGGSVTNAADASITGTKWGIYINHGAGTVVNYGSIASTTANYRGRGVLLLSGGSVTNTASALITGYNGVEVSGISGNAVTVVNDGTIAGGTAPNGTGVALFPGGSVTNAASASITGGGRGVDIGSGILGGIPGGGGTVVNNGSIASSRGYGVDEESGGSVTNSASASITGGVIGVEIRGGAGTVVNEGSIAGPNDGVALDSGGSVTNAASAMITGVFIGGGPGIVVNYGSIKGVAVYSGGSITNAVSATITGWGVSLHAGGTLTNAGSIIGSNGTAAAFGGTGSDLLVLVPGFGFSGKVAGSTSASNTLELASAAPVGTVTGLGTQFTSFGPIKFDAGADWFISGNTTGLAGNISGFAFGDTIEVTGITATGSSYAGGILTLIESSGSVALKLPGSFTTSDFIINNVAAGVDITIACFRSGTRITAARGEIPVEELRVGEMLPAHAGTGQTTLQRVEWVGRRTIDCHRHPKPALVWPVRIRAGAFGPGQPHRDLWLSPDHAVLVDEALIPIKHLINGTTVAHAPMDAVTYYHVELPRHGVLYAEGMPAESYLDTGDRANFENADSLVALHPDFSSLKWEAAGYAPVIVVGPKLNAVRHLMNNFAAPRRVAFA